MADIRCINLDRAENGTTIRCCFVSTDGVFIPDETYVTDRTLEDLMPLLGFVRDGGIQLPAIDSFKPKKFR